MAGSLTLEVARSLSLGHDPVWDPPAAMTATRRWTCSCGAAVLDYRGTEYGSATEGRCPNQRPLAASAASASVQFVRLVRCSGDCA